MTQGQSGSGKTGGTIRTYAEFAANPVRRLYLDANVVHDLFEDALAVKGIKDARRHVSLITFLRAAAVAQCEVLVSPLVVEEVFHVLLKRAGAKLCEIHKCADEKDLRRRKPTEHADMRSKMLVTLQQLIQLLAQRGIAVRMPLPATSGDDTASWGNRITREFYSVLAKSNSAGPMDALHVVIGGLLGCTAFASRDRDFGGVPAITVFRRG